MEDKEFENLPLVGGDDKGETLSGSERWENAEQGEGETATQHGLVDGLRFVVRRERSPPTITEGDVGASIPEGVGVEEEGGNDDDRTELDDDKKKGSRLDPTRWIPMMILAGTVALGGIAYNVFDAQDTESQAAIGTVQEESQLTERELLIQAVGRLIELPQNEEPTIATVADLELLQDEEFFKNAKVGDKVLIYLELKKAFLYDPSADRIVNVAPVILEDEPVPEEELQEGLDKE